MTLEEFLDIGLKKFPREDLIVRLKYKYDFESEYTYSNELLLFDGEYDSEKWLYDWWEGQEDVEVIAFCPIDQVIIPEDTADDKD